jgi:hypothetical protein
MFEFLNAQSNAPIGLQNHIQPSNAYAIKMPAIPIEQIKIEDEFVDNVKTIPWRFGYKMSSTINFNTSGEWHTLQDGSKLWQVKIVCKDAQSINIQFENYHLAKGSFIYLYNQKNNAVLGPYTHENNIPENIMASSILVGDEMIVEYFEPNNITTSSTFEISNVVHGYRTFGAKSSASFGSSCSNGNNINCAIGSNWQIEKRSVSMIVVGGSGFCSGSLLNNVQQDTTPYLMTANHCTQGTTSNSLLSWVFVFNYESPNCNNVNGNLNQSITGAKLVAANKKSDFGLLILNKKIPLWFRPYFSAWNNLDSIPDSVVCIHHPLGDIKKISFANNKCQDSTYTDKYTSKCWKIGHWDNGITEPASSGSPLYNKYHEFVGQLYGGPSFCGCNDSDKNDYFGKFSVSFFADTFINLAAQHWLDSSKTGTSRMVGFDPGFSNSITETKYLQPSEMFIFPNPAIENITIQSNKLFSEIQVFDMLGREIIHLEIENKKQHTLSISNLLKGIYIIKIKNIDNEIAVSKLSKF